MTPRPTVLLVDDEANVLDGLRRALYREPWHLVLAASAAEALQVLATRPIDVVVSDQAMPGMTGLELLARVSQEHPATIRIMLTGHATLDLARRALAERQVTRFFTKPCNSEDLTLAIQQALEQRAAMDATLGAPRVVRRVVASPDPFETEPLTDIVRDEDGAILLDEVTTDPVELLRELEAEMDAAETRARRLREQDGGGVEPATTPGPRATTSRRG